MAAEKNATKAVRVKLTTEQKIEALQLKIQQVKAADEKRLARELAAVTRGSTADETRKKILLGAFVLDAWPTNLSTLSINKKHLFDFLKRDDDRALFDLNPLAATPQKSAAPAAPADPAAVAAAGYALAEQQSLERARARRAEKEKAEAAKLPNALRSTTS